LTQGAFLASSGREVVCGAPTYAGTEAKIQCVSLRATPDGARGEGELARVTFKAERAGTFRVEFLKVLLTNITGSSLFVSQTVDGEVSVQ
jgi:hypothetical protein